MVSDIYRPQGEKKRDKQRYNFTLSDKVDGLIDLMVEKEGFSSRSEVIEFLVLEKDMLNDPIKKLRMLEAEGEDMKEKAEEIEKKKADVLKQMELKQEAGKILKEDEENAIDTVIRAVKRGKTMFELQAMIKTWAVRLNVPYDVLNYKIALRMRDAKIELMKAGNMTFKGEERVEGDRDWEIDEFGNRRYL